jgi:hypothetical protein
LPIVMTKMARARMTMISRIYVAIKGHTPQKRSGRSRHNSNVQECDRVSGISFSYLCTCKVLIYK